MTLRPLWCAVMLTVTIGTAQENRSAAAVTASGRKMTVALDSIFGGLRNQAPEERTIYLLVDPGEGVKKAAFGDELAAAFARNAAHLAKTKIGVARVGAKAPVVLRPSADPKAVVAAVRSVLADARDDIRNVYLDLRTLAGQFGGTKGRREILLVAFANGDAEDDVEGTARELKRQKVMFRCITSEAYLADSYWVARPNARKPKKTKLTGGDNAFVDLPWGWLFQMTVANEVAPSGYANWGLSRLAKATDGRVHLYSPPNNQNHQCAIYGMCLFCDGDHAPSVDTYWRSRLPRYAPMAEPRAKVMAKAAADSYFRAMLRAWQSAAKAGLVRGTPSVKISGNGLTEIRSRVRPVFHYSGTNFKAHARRALAAARECERIKASLQKAINGLTGNKYIPRYKAMAEHTVLMLQLTKVNLITFAGWCRDVAPFLLGKGTTVTSPQPDPNRKGRRASGIGYTNMCLCHGVGPFEEVDLPGGEALRKELAELRRIGDRFEKLYGHTPLGVAVHKAGIARFHLTYPGIAGKRPRKRPKARVDKDPVTERGRPTRPGRSSRGTGGPTTGR